MRLHSLNPGTGARRRRKRLGCGESSGKGKTCGKGHKGQKSRSGASIRPGFEGGQMPLIRQLPKRGFNNAQFRTEYAIVNVGTLESHFENGDSVNETALRDQGLVKGRWDGIKILGDGELTKKLSVEAEKVSGSAREKIENAGGSVCIVASSDHSAFASKDSSPGKEEAVAEVPAESVASGEGTEEVEAADTPLEEESDTEKEAKE